MFRDASALAVGAEATARAIAERAERGNADVRIVRNGSRGMFWLEPLVEVVTPIGRIAYGPVRLQDVDGLFAAGFLVGGSHRLRLGDPAGIAYFRTQERL